MSVEFDTSSPKFAEYSEPGRLVTGEWLQERLGRPGLVVVESDEDVLLYETGHIPGAVKIDWHTDLNDPVVRDYVDGDGFAELLCGKGIARDDTVVFYGDKNNWWAAYALWVFTPLRARRRAPARRRARQVDRRGPAAARRNCHRGRRPTTPCASATTHRSGPSSTTCWRTCGKPAGRRALARGVHGRAHAHARLPRGGRAARRAHPRRPAASRGRGRPTTTARFKPRGELARSTRGAGAEPRRRRHRLLPDRRAVEPHVVRADPPARLPQVRNYDGSWTEWGNAVRVPIATGSEPGTAPS